MLPGTGVGRRLGPGHIVVDGDAAPKKGHTPIFDPFLLRPNGWMDQDASWYGGRLWPRRHCVRLGPSSRAQEKKAAEQPPTFRPMSIVIKRLDES